MKKAAVLISALFAVCTLCSCAAKDKSSDASAPNFDAASEITSTLSTESDSDTETTEEKQESKKEESEAESKNESKNEESETESKAESKTEESSSNGRDDVIPSRSDEYEAASDTIARPPESSDSTDSSTDTSTDTTSDTDSDTSENTDTNSEEVPDPPYLSGLWIVEKMLDSEGKEVDGRDVYGSVFNYAGVLDLDEYSEFRFTIGIIPEGFENTGYYEQRDNTLILHYDDANLAPATLNLTKVDGTEMLILPVVYGGNNYKIYFSR